MLLAALALVPGSLEPAAEKARRVREERESSAGWCESMLLVRVVAPSWSKNSISLSNTVISLPAANSVGDLRLPGLIVLRQHPELPQDDAGVQVCPDVGDLAVPYLHDGARVVVHPSPRRRDPPEVARGGCQ